MVANIVLVFLFSLCLILPISQATTSSIISANQALKDGETIVSAEGNFELGFFTIGSLRDRYLGIWYKKISVQTIVWVANRDFPLKDPSGKLILSKNGTLFLFNSSNLLVWSSSSKRVSTNPVAQILDTGNFVVRNADDDQDPENYIWQSFDCPGDTFLPGMKYGMNLSTGLNRYLTSWRTQNDPSTGNYSNILDPSGVPQYFLKRNSVDVFRAGPWNGLRFTGMPNLKPNPIYRFQFVFNDQEAYYTYELINSSVITRMELNPNGALQRYTWVDRAQSWNFYLSAQMDNCDRYALCGSYGSCNINNSPACGCVKGFVPRSLDEWYAGDWSQGCFRKVELDCRDGEDFLKISGVKLPDTRKSWYHKNMDLNECKRVCLRNCSCTAYSNFDIRDGGSGCILWFGDLIDIREYNENGQDLYVRLAASEIEAYSGGKKRIRKILVSVLSVGLVLLGICIISLLVLNKKEKIERKETMQRGLEHVPSDKKEEGDLELPVFDLDTIARATDDFLDSNKLGQGGFGPVYKGVLEDGQEIAVKRLSRTSRQGLEEFKNEVRLIAKLQHRNLVKILGCCVQEEERMLIYEYLANKSLDSFIFDKEQCMVLDWPKRFNIIKGIARGLVYLHQDSRLRIIHRDLKASNVLLDSDMNPKISDFGMARTFGGDETVANTTRVVGTYGYMSPEYQVDGFFSVKSDVFSFGVLVLEILSGKRNRGFCNLEHKLNLLGHAWKLYKEDRTLEVINEHVKESCNDISEILRSVHVGLLCVQQNPEDRPNMSMAVLMLSSEMALPEPKEPGFFTERNLLFSDSASIQIEVPSNNVFTMTLVEPR